MNERREVHYSGQVQGVGFRYTTRSIADGFDVAGYVRNLPDGEVELIVEGEKTEVDRFLQEVERKMQRYIREARVDCGTASGQFEAFEIRF